MKIFRAIFDAAINFIFPPFCPLCREIVDKRGELCEKCAEKILSIEEIKNPQPPISGALRLTKYRKGTRNSLRRVKFLSDLNSLSGLKSILNKAAEFEEVKNFLREIDVAVAVPISEEKLKKRGFNQSEQIFADELKNFNIPLENILTRTKETSPLYNLNRTERKAAVSGVFSPTENLNLTGKNVLIVDDIYTTGATVTECGRVLKNCGAAKIFVLVLASDFDEEFKNSHREKLPSVFEKILDILIERLKKKKRLAE